METHSTAMIVNLQALSHVGQQAFEINLPDKTVFHITEIVRRVPNKRLVCKGIWKKQPVFSKLFIGERAKHYAQRDSQGVAYLIKANIATPPLLYAGKVEGVEVLIFQAIDVAGNAQERYNNLRLKNNHADDDQTRLNLMQQLTKAVAHQHNAGIIQTDMYLKNFLVKDSVVYSLDGDGIHPLFPIFKQQQKRRNLATLFSKMDALDDDWIASLYEVYSKEANIAYCASNFIKVWSLTHDIRHQNTSNYADKKVFRTCTDVTVSRDFTSFSAIANGFNADNISLALLDNALNNSAQLIKNGNTCTVGKAVINHQQVVIKRYNFKNMWHSFELAFRQSRAAKSWANAHRLVLLNIATPKPVALVEVRFGFLRRQAYFVNEYCEAPDIAQFFAQTIDTPTKHKVADEIALMFYKLSLLNISHGDCKASNIKIMAGKPILLDLDSMQAHTFAWWFEQKHIKDLKRLMRNWAQDAEISAILKHAFVQAYDEIDDYQFAGLLARAGIA